MAKVYTAQEMRVRAAWLDRTTAAMLSQAAEEGANDER